MLITKCWYKVNLAKLYWIQCSLTLPFKFMIIVIFMCLNNRNIVWVIEIFRVPIKRERNGGVGGMGGFRGGSLHYPQLQYRGINTCFALRVNIFWTPLLSWILKPPLGEGVGRGGVSTIEFTPYTYYSNKIRISEDI